MKIRSGYHQDLGVVPVAREHFLTKAKKRWLGQAVVFENDRLLHMRERPLQSGEYPRTTTDVLFGEFCFNDARPIHTPKNRRAHLLTEFDIAAMASTGAICNNEQAPRLCGADRRKNSARQFGPVKDEKHNGREEDEGRGRDIESHLKASGQSEAPRTYLKIYHMRDRTVECTSCLERAM